MPPDKTGLVSPISQAALFIGGKSKRMGIPKTLLKKAQTTSGAWLANLLNSAFHAPPWLVGHAPMATPWQTHPQLKDPTHLAGPIAGFHSLSKVMASQPIVVLAVDLFFFEEPALNWLLSQKAPGTCLAIWPRFPNRPFGEPLASIYSEKAIAIMLQNAASGTRALHKLMPRECRYEPVIPMDLQKHFANVNRPEDLPYSRQDL